ncbi:MAG: type II secretion system protein [Bacilli bacterium]|nr:type II secretion system protein [Bacilli bacterium]
MKLLNVKRNKKRLDNKGFTLIELLAVIVILAIVMGISANSVLNSINQSRKSSLHSTAQNAANNLNTWISEDMIVTDNAQKKLGDDFISGSQDNEWHCIAEFTSIVNKGKAASLMNALSLNTKDLVLTTSSVPVVASGKTPTPTVKGVDTGSTCSALRYNSSTGGYEILLVAKNGGKYYVSADKYALDDATHKNRNYAFSRASEAGTDIND